jgi:PAS domain S-box-containing protein
MKKFKVDIDLIFDTFAGRALILVDSSGTIIKANPDAAHLAGKNDIADIIGKDWDFTFNILSPDDFSFSTLINSTTGFSNFSLTSSSPGKPELLKVKVDPFDVTEQFSGRYYFITCRKQESKDWEDILFKVMKSTEQSFGKNYVQSLTKALAETLSVDFVFIGKLIKGEKDMVRPISFWDRDQYNNPIDHPLKGSPAAEVITNKQKFIPDNVTKLFPKDTGLKELGVKSYLGTPISYSNGKPLGLLVVMDSKPMVESAAAAYVLNTFASRVGAEIEFAETRKTLLEKDRKLKSVIDAIPHPIFYKDIEGRYEGINKAFINAVGLKEDEIIGKKTIRADRQNKSAAHDKEILSETNQVTYESSQLTSTGEEKQFLMTKSSILDENGEIGGIAGAAMDITNLKIAEKELKESEEKFRRLFSSANDAIFIMKDGVFIDCNERTLEIFACERDDIIGKLPYEFSPELQPDGKDSKSSALEKIKEAVEGNPQNFYWKHKKKSGMLFDAEVGLNVIKIGNELLIQAIVRDISDKLQLASAAELQKERMAEMYRYISDTKISYDEQLSNLLELATKSLGLDTGMIGRIKDNEYTLIDYYTSSSDLSKGKIYDLQNTYCAITYNQDRLVAIPNMSLSEYKDHPCNDLFNMEAYIGAPFWVKGERYGTLAFMAHQPIDKFKPIDLDFVQMLAQWIGSAMERALFEENLLERDALLETMLREIPIDFSVRDANLNMLLQSDLSKEYWGNNEGKPIDYSDIDDISREKWQEVFNKALDGEVVKGEDNVNINGKPYSFFSVASPVKIKGKVTEVMVINIDISKIKETEEKLKEQNKLLTKLNTELDRFVYSASHDLRAPLASLLGLIDLSSRERNSDSTDHYLELMSKSINTMDRFITDITEYSRNLRLETLANLIDFDKLFTESFNQIQYMLPGPATSSISITGKTPFYSDYERLKMVMNNLISNSIRYKAYGREPAIELNVKITKEKAIIEVNDNGIGIGEKHLQRVFEMFYRANDINVGSGLGLFIVKETIEKLRGTVSITSQLNTGTRVSITLPNLPYEEKPT